THAFGGLDDFVTLAGVKIECDSSLVAHSDGDAVLHSVMDAMLSAAGLEDIGHYFPDTDRRYKGADSAVLLGRVMDEVKERGFAPVNVSVTIEAEKPRLAPHTEAMKQSLARLCGLDASCVAIAAGT